MEQTTSRQSDVYGGRGRRVAGPAWIFKTLFRASPGLFGNEFVGCGRAPEPSPLPE